MRCNIERVGEGEKEKLDNKTDKIIMLHLLCLLHSCILLNHAEARNGLTDENLLSLIFFYL